MATKGKLQHLFERKDGGSLGVRMVRSYWPIMERSYMIFDQYIFTQKNMEIYLKNA